MRHGSSLYFADFINNDGTGQNIFDNIITGDRLYLTYYNGGWYGRTKFFEREFNSSNYFKSNRYINYTYDSLTDIKISLLSPYIYTNCVYDYQIDYVDRTTGVASFLVFYFYVADNNTVIVDNVIDPGNSIPNLDDYLNKINNLDNNLNNNENTDLIIDNINSGDNAILDDSQVSTIINDNLGSSGDILANLQFSNYHYSGDLIVYTLFSNICDVLLDDNDIYFDYSMHGESPTRIYASDFTTPNNQLTMFIRLFLIFIFLYVGFYNIKHIIDLINEGKAPLILVEEDADVVIAKM